MSCRVGSLHRLGGVVCDHETYLVGLPKGGTDSRVKRSPGIHEVCGLEIASDLVRCSPLSISLKALLILLPVLSADMRLI